ncbi:MAG: LysR family transcriptional regulator [Betaproteobacteria bacterium]|nr:LysR family transcriptional regulator [Betaproteobacteria bacterium]
MSIESARKWDLARLELFAAVADLGSLTRVAAARGSTQPVISRQIAALERECGGRLFARTGRGMALTELGQRLLPRIKSMLAEAKQLSEEVGAASGVAAGEVRIGALPSLYKLLICPLFRVTQERFPKVRLHVFEGSGGQIDEWIANGYIDIGLPYRYGKRLPGDAQRLIDADSYLIGPAGDRLTGSPTVEFVKLARKPLVLPGAPSVVRVMLDQLAKRKHITLDIVLAADSLQIQKEIVLNGYGYTILPRHAVLTEIDLGTLQAARIVNPGIKRTVVLVTTSSRPLSLACREVAKLIRQLAQVTR